MMNVAMYIWRDIIFRLSRVIKKYPTVSEVASEISGLKSL